MDIVYMIAICGGCAFDRMNKKNLIEVKAKKNAETNRETAWPRPRGKFSTIR